MLKAACYLVTVALALGCAAHAALQTRSVSPENQLQPADDRLPDIFTVVAFDESGVLGFHGTVVIEEVNESFRCAANLVLFDQRGQIRLDNHAGSVRTGEFGCVSQDNAWVRVGLPFYPGISDGDLIFTIHSDKSSGEWRFETGHGISMHGKMVVVRQQLEDDLSKLGVQQHIERWTSTE